MQKSSIVNGALPDMNKPMRLDESGRAALYFDVLPGFLNGRGSISISASFPAGVEKRHRKEKMEENGSGIIYNPQKGNCSFAASYKIDEDPLCF